MVFSFLSQRFPGLARHLSVLKASWGLETERARTHHQITETEFLPAVLEVIEAPPSPMTRALLLILSALVVCAILWSVFGRLDTVAVAVGQTIPVDRVKLIQPMEIGVVRKIHVSEGERVNTGQLLVELDPTVAGADAAQAKEALLAARIEVARARAVLHHLDGRDSAFVAPASTPPELKVLMAGLVQSTVAEYEARREILLESRSERRAELAAAQSEREKLEETLPLLKSQLDIRQELAQKGLNSKLVVLELEERYIDRLKNLEVVKSNAVRSQAAISGLSAQLEQLEQDLRKTTLSELTEAKEEAVLRLEEIKKVSSRRELLNLRSPVLGTVQQLAIHTIGGVVQPAETLMVLVPHDAKLVVEAQVLNKDIGFVHEGQSVAVKLEAFPFTDFGFVDGTVEHVSRDAVADENKGLVFIARVRLDRTDIDIGGKPVSLVPGMAVQAEIKTGNRRIIQYLLSPIAKTLSEAARER